jgi:hypothetical protein
MKNWRYFGVKLFGTGWYQLAFYAQNGVLAFDTIVLFCTQRDLLGQRTYNPKPGALCIKQN